MRRLLVILMLAGTCVVAEAQTFRTQTHEPKVPIAWNRLYSYKDLMGHFRRLVKAYPQFLTLEEIGRSSHDRPLYVIRVNNPKTGPESGKAGMFIDANIHGNEIQGGEVCLYTVWYLMEYYAKLPAVKRLVDERVFYVQPVTNVDARVWWFSKPATAHWPRSGLAPYDNDRDGRADEDGYDDLDKDGEITRMRKKVPMGDGTHRRDPTDPRRLIRIAEGEKGDYLQLGSEGIDNDGDGRVNEDTPGGYDMNRNWPGDWSPRYVQYGAGDYPLSHPETRAVADYVLARPNIAGYQSYHNAGGMILRGPGNKYQPKYLPADLRVYDRLGKVGEKMLPFYRYLIVWKDLYAVYGGEVTWAAEDLGVVSFTNELWTNSRLAQLRQERIRGRDEAATLKREAQRKEQMRWIDRLGLGEQFVAWKPYDHPTYGKIEIGGFKQMWGRVPPSFLLEEMYHRNAAFTLLHADSMPLVRLDAPTVKPLGGGVYQIDAVARNDRLIQTRTAAMKRYGIGRRDLFRITGGEKLSVLAGGKVTGRVALVMTPKAKDPARVWFDEGIGSRARVRVRWIVRGSGTVSVLYDAEKGGRAERKVKLR